MNAVYPNYADDVIEAWKRRFHSNVIDAKLAKKDALRVIDKKHAAGRAILNNMVRNTERAIDEHFEAAIAPAIVNRDHRLAEAKQIYEGRVAFITAEFNLETQEARAYKTTKLEELRELEGRGILVEKKRRDATIAELTAILRKMKTYSAPCGPHGTVWCETCLPDLQRYKELGFFAAGRFE